MNRHFDDEEEDVNNLRVYLAFSERPVKKKKKKWMFVLFFSKEQMTSDGEDISNMYTVYDQYDRDQKNKVFFLHAQM